jgi:hypothetical protein
MQTLNEYCEWLEDLTVAGDTINSNGLQKWIENYTARQLKIQQTINDLK